ncbi:type IA DNA topoisomerase [Lactobacillus kefiranofaciens]|uniref:DNA topoisomerase n=3 Tax=Lactobacillus TaxID=1578 RepID=A0AAX3UIB7_9LACO|nr:type IA DNA topoisomerase [Lactobacillus kefiranofaciens]AEG41819.1 DNA topoisomerase [Lactobacillus kefiranofaciens subsp. kefiranofaciens]KRM20935.1 DNA topoisomerase [Lactobacillus kefiranofaciens subsp. kefiranofaciens DSM 5016 = JCM 6985]WGO87078.1 DNA topoisomerase III [Lactobacillus kefiranofaciens]SDA66973.1 DNA topoisomerase-3 [Lactobacillus kefiranofaciens]
MTTVILAEKPSQARSYVEAFQRSTKKQGYYIINDSLLPPDTVITFGFGHLVELAAPEAYDAKYKHWSLSNLPIFPAHYQFIVPTDKKAQFKIVKEWLSKADTIVVATDSDREGENIAWSIMNQAKINLKQKTIKRLWINSLEKDAIRSGFKALKDGWAFYPKYQEAQTRQISDWLIGMNGSPLYTLLLRQNGVRGVYSIGRVQTPTLYMVYQRDQAIKNFKPEPYFELNAEILANQQKFVAKLDPYQRFKDEAELMTFMQAKHVQKGSQDGLIKDVQKQAKKSASPRLFSLSALQTMINRRYHASAADVLKAVQALYEAKYLSYPRTDSQYITDQEFTYLRQNLARYQKLVSKEIALPQIEPQSRYVNGKKVQEHHAIIMTKTVPSQEQLAKLSKLEQQVYDLVLRTTLAMFADPYEYEETTIITQVGDANFKATGKVPTKQGWQALFDDHKADQQEAATLPIVHQGDQVQANLQTPQKETTPPVPFTEGTLITAMKTAGKTLDDEAAQAILKDVQGIGTSATRANVLEILKKRGYLVTEKNKLHVSEAGITLCKAVELEPLLTSPEMTAKWEQALQQISTEERTPDNFLNQIKKFVAKLIADVPTQLTGSAAIKQQIDHQQQAQKAAEVFLETPQATVLNKQKFYIVKPKQGEDFTLPKKWSSKALGKTAIKALVTKGETSKLKGFKSKKGKSFDAKLKLDGHKLSFDFD